MVRRRDHYAAFEYGQAVAQVVRAIATVRPICGDDLRRAYNRLRPAGVDMTSHPVGGERARRRHGSRAAVVDHDRAMPAHEYDVLRPDISLVTAALSVRWAEQVEWDDLGRPLDAGHKVDADRVEATAAYRQLLGAQRWAEYERTAALRRAEHAGRPASSGTDQDEQTRAALAAARAQIAEVSAWA